VSIEQHTSKRGTTALHSGQTPGRSDLTVRGLIDRLANWDMGFVLPAVLVMVMLVIFPTLYALAISLLRWHLTEATPPTFAGLGNYLFLFTETRFWEALGFVATEETAAPYVHLPLTSDHLDLAFHRAGTLERPMLVFADDDMPTRIAALRERGIAASRELPRGLDPGANALLEAPEGTPLLLVTPPAD